MERIRLDIRDLQVVLTMAGTGSTAKAAPRLHLTQSAVSRALLVAEEKLGVRLFQRGARGLTPTAAGERLIEGAGAVVAQLAELERQVLSPEVAPARVRMVCECYTAYRWLPSAILSLRQVLPMLQVSLGVDHTDAPVPALLAGDVDIALVTTATVKRPLETVPLFSDEIVFIVSPSHPLSRRSSLVPRDLESTTFITSNVPPGERKWFLQQVFGKKKPKLDVVRLPLTEAIVDAVRAGMGVAALSEWISAPYLEQGGLVLKRLASGPLRRPWRMAFRPEARDVARELASVLESAVPRGRAVRERSARALTSSATHA